VYGNAGEALGLGDFRDYIRVRVVANAPAKLRNQLKLCGDGKGSGNTGGEFLLPPRCGRPISAPSREDLLTAFPLFGDLGFEPHTYCKAPGQDGKSHRLKA
jgi:hypothetical protein